MNCGGVGGGGLAVDLAGTGDLLEMPGAQQGDPVGQRHGLFLVVRDENKSDSDFALQGFQFGLHLPAQVGVEGRKWFVEQQHARAIDQSAGQGDALLLSAAQSRWSGLGEVRTFSPSRAPALRGLEFLILALFLRAEPYATFSKTERCGKIA